MSTVNIKPTESGAIINVYQSNPKFGYIQLQSSQMSVEGGWVREKTRTALLRAEVELLEKFVHAFGKTGTVPGQIVINEFRESELPENFKSRLNSKLDYEDAVQPFIKRAGKDGIELTSGGERILRFTDYDSTSKMSDTRVAHDNVSEVAEFRAQSALKPSAQF